MATSLSRPSVVRDRVSSAVYNLGEPNTFMNLVLQGKARRAARSTTRFVVNSTVGVLGLFDVAAKMGLPRAAPTSARPSALGRWARRLRLCAGHGSR
jgi:phospholipid-binding lipoprotein MlaA